MKNEVETKVRRQGKPTKSLLELELADATALPSFEEDPEAYHDWGEEEDFQVRVGRGECAS